LFGYVSGTVKNLGIVSGTLALESKAGTTYVGPLVAYLTGTVENCYSQAVVSTSITNIVYAGGLIGHVDTAATVKNSYASGHISAISSSGFAYAGGFVGANKGKIEGSLAFGNVTAKGSNDTYSRNGGFVSTNTGTMTECYRNEAQTLVKYTTSGSAYCEDGVTVVPLPEDTIVSMNLWGFGLEYMDVLREGFRKALVRIMAENPMKGEYYIQSPINDQIADGSATYEVLTSGDKWFGVTYKEDKPDVVAKFAALKDEGAYPRNLWD
jgi:hypothetical protein